MCDVMSVDPGGILRGISKGRDTEPDLWLRALCQAEFGGLTKWIIWPLLHHLFFFFSFLFVCAELLQKTNPPPPKKKKQEQEFEHLPDVLTRLISPRCTSFQVLAERIITA